jgi:hypothetical protein
LPDGYFFFFGNEELLQLIGPHWIQLFDRRDILVLIRMDGHAQ